MTKGSAIYHGLRWRCRGSKHDERHAGRHAGLETSAMGILYWAAMNTECLHVLGMRSEAFVASLGMPALGGTVLALGIDYL